MVTNLPGLRAGLRCTVELEDPERGVETYPSRVEDYQDERLVIMWPSRRGLLLPLHVGDFISLTVPTADAQGRIAATLYLDGEVTERIIPSEANPVGMLVVRVVAVGRQQQRGHYRLYVTLLPIDCVVWDRPFGRSESEATWRPIKAMITDVSAGGVGLVSDQEVLEGARLHLRFPYPMAEGVLSTDLRVRLSQPLTSGDQTRFKLGAEFETLTEAQRERLARCIHRYQLEQRRRERERQQEQEQLREQLRTAP